MSLFLFACTRILNAAICNNYNDVCCAKYMLVSLNSSNRVRLKIEDCSILLTSHCEVSNILHAYELSHVKSNITSAILMNEFGWEICSGSSSCLQRVFFVTPLGPNSDQQQFSLYNIHTLSRSKVMRINKWSPKRKYFDLLLNSLN